MQCHGCKRQFRFSRLLWVQHATLALVWLFACVGTVSADYLGISAQPSYRMLGRLGHELLTKTEHTVQGEGRHLDPYTRAWKNTIAICSIMKDERLQDVKEFISYHRYIGVDKIYLRENGNSSEIQADMQPYVNAGILDFGLLAGPKHPTQTNWFNACSKMAQPAHSWVAFIDLDEFIVVLNKQKAVTERNALKNLLRRSFRYTAAVSMQWVLFGAAGHKTPPAEGQLAGFNKCTGVLSKQMKCLGNSYWFHDRATFRPMHVHQCNFRFGAVSVLGNSEPLNMWRVKMVPGSDNRGPFGASYAGHLSEAEHKYFTQVTNDYQVVLFHYVTRSQEDFVQRKITRRSGVYATQFAAMQPGDGADPSGAQLDAQYAAFESQHGFDGNHSICEQGGAIAAAMADARAKRGWTEFKSG